VQNEPNFNLGEIHATLYFVGDCSGETLPASSKRIKNKPNQSQVIRSHCEGAVADCANLNVPRKTKPIRANSRESGLRPGTRMHLLIHRHTCPSTHPPTPSVQNKPNRQPSTINSVSSRAIRSSRGSSASTMGGCAKQTQSAHGSIGACRFATRLYAAELSPPPQKNKPNQSQSAASTRVRPALFHNSREIPRPPAYNLPQCCSPGRAEVGNLHDRPQRCLRQGAGK